MTAARWVDKDCPRITVQLRVGGGMAPFTGNEYNAIDGTRLLVFRVGRKWHAAEIESGYRVTVDHGFTTRDAAMIESQKLYMPEGRA